MIYFIAWKGRGLCIPIFTVAGFMLPMGLWMVLGKSEEYLLYLLPAAIILSVGATWLCALTICKPSERTEYDPATGASVVCRQTHSFMLIPALGCAWTLTVCVGLLVGVLAFFLWLNSASHAKAAFPKAGAILTASEKAFSEPQARTVAGNNPEAEALASLVATEMQAKAAKSRTVLPDGKIYCYFAESLCAVIVEITSDISRKSSIHDQVALHAWSAATSTLKSSGKRPKNLLVIVRAGARYSRATMGQARGEAPGGGYVPHSEAGDPTARMAAEFMEGAAK